MANPILMLAGALTWLAVHHAHQTCQASDATSLVIEPPLMTVVVPAFDEEQYIPKCLESIYSQTSMQAYPDKIDVIAVIDNRSTDATAEIAAAYGAQIIHAPPGKLSAKECGLRNANGEIVVFIDADEIIAPNILNIIADDFAQDTDLVAVSGVFLGQGPLRALHVYYNNLRGFFNYGLVGNLSAVRKDVWIAAGGYDETIDQADRRCMVLEEEHNIKQRLEQFGKVAVDTRLSVELQRDIDPCMFCQTCINAYCEQRRSGERF